LSGSGWAWVVGQNEMCCNWVGLCVALQLFLFCEALATVANFLQLLSS